MKVYLSSVLFNHGKRQDLTNNLVEDGNQLAEGY